MSEANFKNCRYCSEQINETAKICPRCRQWLTVFSWRNPVMLAGATLFWAFLMFACLVISMHKMFDPGMDFYPYHDQISVVESSLFLGTNAFSKTPIIGIVALVTNQSDKAWTGIELDARYFDKTGKLIDVGYGEYDWPLYPKSDGAVRINSGSVYPLADYASYKIYVGSARDPRSRF